MKHFSLFLFFCVLLPHCYAQNPLNISIEVYEPYPTHIEYYLENADNLFITVSNITAIEQQVYYHVRVVSSDNGIDVKTLPGIKPPEPVIIPSNFTKFYSSTELEEDFPFSYPEDIDLSGISQEQIDFIETNRVLPEGTYQICITAIDYDTDVPLAINCSSEFFVSYGDVPVIYEPYNESVVPSSEAEHVTIAWEPPFTLDPPTGTFSYELMMLDITDYPFGDLDQLFSDPGVFPVLYEQNIDVPIFNYDVPPQVSLIEGHQYALRVQAIDHSGTYVLANNGYSEVSTFWYGYHPDDLEDDPGSLADDQANDCYLNCYYEANISQNPINSTAGLTEIQAGNFTVTNITWTNTSGDNASGTGEVAIPFLNDVLVKVTFDGIAINNNGRMYQGAINPVKDVSYDPTSMTSSIAAEMNNFIRNGRVVGALASGGSMGLPLGFIQNVAGYNFMFGLTDMRFEATRASCQIMQNLHMPQLGEEGWISMALTDACLIPAGLAGEYYLHPVNDVVLPYQGDIMIRFDGSVSDDPDEIREKSTFFQMDCNGLKGLSIRGAALFPESTLVKENEDADIIEGKVEAKFALQYDLTTATAQDVYAAYGDGGVPEEYGLHMLVQLDIDPFQFAGLKAWGFEVSEAWLDVSEIENPPGIQWPESYNDANIEILPNGNAHMQATWTGIYIKEMEIKLPPDFLNKNTREGFSTNHMIIDPLVTATFAIEDLVEIGDGEVDDWSFSMDSLFISIVQNRLENGGFSGLIGMPITKRGQYFRYTALIEDSNTSNTSLDAPNYVFSVSPSDDIEFPFMVAKAALSSNSYIMAQFSPGNDDETYFQAHLQGGVGINSELFTPEDDDPGIPLYLPVIDFAFDYGSQTGFGNSYFSFGAFEQYEDAPVEGIEYDLSWGPEFSDQSFAGFPLNIESVDIIPLSADEIRFNVTPSVTLATGSGGIAGSVGIDFDSKLKTVSGEKKLTLRKMGVSSLMVDTRVYGLSVSGEVSFYNDLGSDGIGQKGARGDVQVMLPIGLGAKMAAEFGRHVNNPSAAIGTSQNYNYWYLDGMIYLPNGLPVGASGLGVYGFGGGVYVNMTNGSFDENDVGGVLDDVSATQVSTNAQTNPVSRTDMTPTADFGSYGLKLAGTLGTYPLPLLLNMDVYIYGEFSESSGINMVGVGGDVFHLCPISEREQFGLWSSAAFSWEKISDAHSIYAGGMDLFLNLGLLQGRKSDNRVVGVDFQVEVGGDNVWFFHAGDPRNDDYGVVRFDFPLIGKAEASAYFMAGHNLPVELPIPEKVAFLMDNSSTGSGKNKLDESSKASSSPVERNEIEKIISESGQGIAFGAELSVIAGIDAKLIYATLEAYLGFDINITQSDTRVCTTSGGNITPGWNGWYAMGQVYAGLEGKLGIRFRFQGKGFDLNLLTLGAAVMLSGAAPNPEWMDGRAGVYYSVLNGLFSGKERINITIGEKCIPDNSNPFAGLEIIYETSPADGDELVSVFVDPTASFILPIEKKFTLPVLDEDGNIIDQSFELTLHSMTVKNTDNGNAVQADDEFIWDENNTQVTMQMDQILAEYSNFNLTVELRGWEYNGINKTELKGDDGKTWKEKKNYNFSTGEAPYPIPDEEIVRTFPIRNQRYLLQNDMSLKIAQVVFSRNMKNDDPDKGYFPENNDDYRYEYYWRWQDLNGGDPITSPITVTNIMDDVVSTYPDFENNTIYSCQLVRKTIPAFGTQNELVGGVRVKQLFDIRDDEYDVYASGQVNITTPPLDPGKTAAHNEDIIYQFYFKTSKYNTLEEKLNLVSLEMSEAHPDNPSTNYPIVKLLGDEGFDTYDVLGKYYENELVIEKRIQFFSQENENLPISAAVIDEKNSIGSSTSQPRFTPAGDQLWQFAKSVKNEYFSISTPFWDVTHTFTYEEEMSVDKINIDTPEKLGTEMDTEAPTQSTVNVTLNPNFDRFDDFIIDYTALPSVLNAAYVTGYEDPLSPEEIESAWNGYLDIQKYQYNLSDSNRLGNASTIGPGGQFNGNSSGGFYDNSRFPNPNFGNQNNTTPPYGNYQGNPTNNTAPPGGVELSSPSNTSSSYVERLTVMMTLPYTLWQDAKALFDDGYNIYYNYHDDVLRNLAWQNYLDDNYPGLLEGVEFIDANLQNYWFVNNQGNYKLFAQPNISVSLPFIGATKTVKTFLYEK